MNYLYAVLFLIASYIIGSIPNGLIVGNRLGHDLRYEGSGNTGATNSVRVLGKKAGYAVFVFDFAKGALVICIIRILEACGVWYNPFVINGESLLIVYGAAAVIGHDFSCFMKFKGGKGVATTIGAALATAPFAALCCIPVWVIIFYCTGYVSLASMIAAVAFLPFTGCFYFVEPFAYSYIFFVALVALLIIRHKSNIKRLINHNENSFKKKKEKTPEK